MTHPLDCRREAFAVPDGIAYLNAAYMGPLSHRVVSAGRAGLERKMQPWTIAPSDFFEPVDRLRELFAQVIDADADGVAILPAVSYGVAVAANNLPVAPGRRIVVLAEQFPSNVYAWKRLAEEKGAEVVTVARPADHDWTRAVLDVLDERTAICAVETFHWSDGGLLDLVRISRRTREVGAALVVDGTQSVGAVPFDVEAIRPDFLITALYKWLLAPYGAAMLWCAPERREGRPLELSWITRSGSGDFAHLVDYSSSFRPGARRYDVGQTADFALIPALQAALEQTLEWGVGRICSYIRGLTELVAERADGAGLAVAPANMRAPHFLGVHLSGADPEAVASALAGAEVFVSVRGDAVRVSPHVYNDERDIEALFEALERAL